MATWNTTFETSPADGDNPSAGAGKIRELKVEVGDRGNREHTWAGTTAADGIHRAGSAKVYFTTATPTLQPDGTTALTTTDKGRLWLSTAGSGVRIHNGTGFVSTGVTLSTAQTIYGVKTFGSTAVFNSTIQVKGGYSTGNTSKTIKHLVKSIGTWNMQTTQIKKVIDSRLSATILSHTVNIGAVIIGDAGHCWAYAGTDPSALHVIHLSVGGMDLQCATGSYFIAAGFNDATINRGWVMVTYVE